MKYRTLKSCYHTLSPSYYQNEVQHRLSSLDTVQIPIMIRDFKTKSEHPAFLTCVWEISLLLEKIDANVAKINRVFWILPKGAQAHYRLKCLVEEVQMTNDIENIFSTRKEINDTIAALNAQKNSKRLRFQGMLKKYRLLLNDDVDISLKSNADVRRLYEEIVGEEIAAEDRLDGVIYRKSGVHLESQIDHRVHEGVLPEERIIEDMDQALLTLNDPSLPELVRIALFHYLIGYIHPFYDGNGRFNRFVTSALVYQKSSMLVGLAISSILKKNRPSYYKAFRTCNQDKNAGDTTPFVIQFLGFINEAAEHVYSQLNEGYLRLIYYEDMLAKLMPLLKEKKAKILDTKFNILYVFAQSALFGGEGIGIDELIHYSGYGATRARAILKSLIEEDAVPITQEQKPKKYWLDLDRFDQYLSERIRSE